MRYEDLVKAVLINIFILSVVQMTMHNVKGGANSDEPTELLPTL